MICLKKLTRRVIIAMIALCGFTGAAVAENRQIVLVPNWSPPPGADAATIAARKPWLEAAPANIILHIDLPLAPGQSYTPDQLAQILNATETLLYLPEYEANDTKNLIHDIGYAVPNMALSGEVMLNRGVIKPGETIVSAPFVFKQVKRLDQDMTVNAVGFHTVPAGTVFASFEFRKEDSTAVKLWCAEASLSHIFNVHYPDTLCLGGDEVSGYKLFSSGAYDQVSGIPYAMGASYDQDIAAKPVWHDINPKDFTLTFSVTFEGATDKGAVFHKHLSRVVDGKTYINNNIDNQIYPNGKYHDEPHAVRADGFYLYAFPSARLYFKAGSAANTLTLAILKNKDVRPEYNTDAILVKTDDTAIAKTKLWRMGVLQLEPESLTRITNAEDHSHVTFTIKGQLAEPVQLTEGRTESAPFGQTLPAFVRGAIFYRAQETFTEVSGMHVKKAGWCGPIQMNRATPPTVSMTCFRDDQAYTTAYDFKGAWETFPINDARDDGNVGKTVTAKLPAHEPYATSEKDQRLVYITVFRDPKLPRYFQQTSDLYVEISLRDFGAGWKATMAQIKESGEGAEVLESYFRRLYILYPNADGQAILNLWDKKLIINSVGGTIDAHIEAGGDEYGIHTAPKGAN